MYLSLDGRRKIVPIIAVVVVVAVQRGASTRYHFVTSGRSWRHFHREWSNIIIKKRQIQEQFNQLNV